MLTGRTGYAAESGAHRRPRTYCQRTLLWVASYPEIRLCATFPDLPGHLFLAAFPTRTAQCIDAQSVSGPGPPGSGCSHQTTLPAGVRRAPQRCESCRTTCRPRPFSSSPLAWRSLGSAAELSSTSQTSARSLTRRSVTSPREYLTALVTSSETSSSVVGIRSSRPQRCIGSAIANRASRTEVSLGEY